MKFSETFISILAVILLALCNETHGSVMAKYTLFVDAVNGNDLNNGQEQDTAFATIQKAIDSAEEGFKINVLPGTYTEKINFKGKRIFLQGIATPEGVPVLENPGDIAVTFSSNEKTGSILHNFIIKNCDTGILIKNSSPALGNLTIVNNKYGIKADSKSKPRIEHCIFWNNSQNDLLDCNASYSWIQAEVSRLLNEDRIACWDFDNDTGRQVVDLLGNLHGINHGAKYVTGRFGNALSFDGVNDYVDLGISGRYILDKDFSFSTWIKRGSEKTTIFSIEGGPDELEQNNAFLSLTITTDGHLKYIHEYAKAKNEEHDFGVIPEGVWTHIAVVRDSTQKTVTVYINGFHDGFFRYSNQPANPDYEVQATLGARSTGLVTFKGMIDETALFEKAFSSEAIKMIYNSTIAERMKNLNPRFADSDNGDYHLLSEAGRYDPNSGEWINDNISSMCIDAGNPLAGQMEEPMPQGDNINIGAYGGTRYASKSRVPPLLPVRGPMF